MSMIQRRLWGGSSSYDELLRSYGTLLAYWPMDDAGTQTTSADSINETEGGSNGVNDRLQNLISSPQAGTTSINNMHSSTSVYGSHTSGGLRNGILGNVNTSSYQSVWIAIWSQMANQTSTGSGNNIIVLPSGSHMYINPAGTWQLDMGTSGFVTVSSQVPGAAATDKHLTVWTQIWNGSTYDGRVWVATPNEEGLVASDLASATDFFTDANMAMELNGGASGSGKSEWRFSAVSISSGEGPTTAAQVRALYDAGK